jgi:hypothetical protein
MARTRIRKETSSYYPPRARWYAQFFYLADALRRRTALDRLALPSELKPGELAAGLLVPGLAVYFRGPRLWGKAALGASAALALVFIVWLGHLAANVAFGLMISIHATGFAYYCNPLVARRSFFQRTAFTLLILLAMGLFIYAPARDFVLSRWLTPLRINGRVVVVQRVSATRNLHRGDWVAYQLQENQTGEAHNGGAVWVRQGVGFGPILAVAGDQVSFSTNSFTVNGITRPALPHMPWSGELVVPEKHWFLWPDIAISGHGNVGATSVAATLLGLASVNETQYVGKPFRHWFWRRQIIP